MWTTQPADKPFIIPVFLPHSGCPHRCVFCNQNIITSENRPGVSIGRIHDRIERFLSEYRGSARTVQIAFYGGNFLGLPAGRIRALLREAGDFVEKGRVHGIRFSTRPDTIDEPRLRLLEPFPVTTVEIGVQSMDDTVLARAARGHGAGDTENAIRLLKARGYTVGAQLMVGLPGDDPDRLMYTGGRTAALKPDFVRIYPTVVLKNSPLARMYENGTYTPPGLDESVTLAKQLYQIFSADGIPVIRMGLQATADLDQGATILAGPYHPAFGHLVLCELMLDTAAEKIGSMENVPERLEIRVHPRDISRIRGLKNRNLAVLKQRFGIQAIRVLGDERVCEADMVVGPDRHGPCPREVLDSPNSDLLEVSVI